MGLGCLLAFGENKYEDSLALIVDFFSFEFNIHDTSSSYTANR